MMCVPPHLECLLPGMSVILGVSWWRGVGARVGGLGSEVSGGRERALSK